MGTRVDLQEIRAQIAEEQKARSIECFQKVQALLEEHNCILIPTFQILGSNMTSGYQVIAK